MIGNSANGGHIAPGSSIGPDRVFKSEAIKENDLGLGKDVLALVLSKLPPSEVQSKSSVCQLWRRIISNLPDPELSVFGADAWQKFYGLEIEGDIPPFPKDIGQYVRSLRMQVAGKEFGPPCSAILMPKGLTLNKLKDLMEKPTEGNSTKFEYIWNRIVAELGDQAIEESYWFVMTNDVIEGSRNISYAEQMALVVQKTKSDCQLPTTLEAIACCVTHYVSSEKYLFGQDLLTYTRTQEQVDGHPLVVGGFASAGLGVDFNYFDRVSNGVGVRRKFC